MEIVVAIALVLVVLAALNLALFKGDFKVAESLFIDRKPAEVFAKVADLRSWPAWSPWLLHEPNCKLDYSSDPPPDQQGGSYSWDGAKVGAGTMTHVKMDAPRRIAQRLAFRRPFNSTSEVTWDFQEEGAGTKVTWGMAGKMPFFVRFMTGGMTRALGKDYAFGLLRLRQELDPAARAPQLEFHGVCDSPPSTSVVAPWRGSLKDMPAALAELFPKLHEAAKDDEGKAAGMPFSVYRKMNVGKESVVMEAAVPTTKASAGDYQIKEFGSLPCLKVTLTGSYDHLGVAWNQAFTNMRMNKLKYDRKRAPFEVYENDPRTTAPEELQTSIYLPVRI